MTTIWIDTTSGTWGEVDGDQGRLMIVDVEDPSMFEVMTDDQIAVYANRHGHLATTPEQAQPAAGNPWAEDVDYPVADWQYQVANDDTRLGYRDWVAAQKDA